MAFKRPLPISHSSPKINKKTNSCKVCGGDARIKNYGALSCQSCKTFFRRNGFRPEVCNFYIIYLINIIFFCNSLLVDVNMMVNVK
jgi:hypothetical protein